ncbi:MAG: hypothetical protein GF347_03785 [Candidatus Moranbacteria bacterium]|nr:hypothetical protein [Candidatus Moranbacteria bacterium]
MGFEKKVEREELPDFRKFQFFSLEWEEVPSKDKKHAIIKEMRTKSEVYSVEGRRWELDMAEHNCTVERLSFKIIEPGGHINLNISLIHSKNSQDSVVVMATRKTDQEGEFYENFRNLVLKKALLYIKALLERKERRVEKICFEPPLKISRSDSNKLTEKKINFTEEEMGLLLNFFN